MNRSIATTLSVFAIIGAAVAGYVSSRRSPEVSNLPMILCALALVAVSVVQAATGKMRRTQFFGFLLVAIGLLASAYTRQWLHLGSTIIATAGIVVVLLSLRATRAKAGTSQGS